MKHVPLFRMKDSSLKGFFIRTFHPDITPPPEILQKVDFHKDDFYIFQLVKSGRAPMMVDFNDFELTESSVLYILPGQIHRRFHPDERVAGWSLLVEPTIIPPDYREIFEDNFTLQQLVTLSPDHFQQCAQLLSLLFEKYHEMPDQPFHVSVMHTILQSFLGIVAGSFIKAGDGDEPQTKAVQLAVRFRALLQQHFTTIKKPSAYAAMMHISEPYLNEVIKKQTGFSLSYLIRHQIMLEAKRLLLYTDLSVKEIAYELGYEDADYFSRTFKNFAAMTPLTFRATNRK